MDNIDRKNWNCQGADCLEPDGEIRLIPCGGGGDLILCHECYMKEMLWRHERNKSLPVENKYPIPRWSNLEVWR